MLRKTLYPKLEAHLTRIADTLHRKGFTANQLTFAGLALNFVAGWILASGHLFFGGIFLLLASLGDLLDGPLARLSNKASAFGAFLDSTIDRYSDFFLFGGLALYFARLGQTGFFLITMGIILGAFVISYSKARAENFINECSVGVFERAERVLCLALGTILSPLLPLFLWILLIGTHLTAIQRILYTRQALSNRSS